MIEWLTLSHSQRQEALNLAARQTGLPEMAIEKDWLPSPLKLLFPRPGRSTLFSKEVHPLANHGIL